MKPIRNSLLALAAALSLAAFSASAGAASFTAGVDPDATLVPTLVPGLDAAALQEPLPAHASLYSFSDVFRLTAGSMPLAEYPLAPVQGTAVALPVSATAAPSRPAPAAQGEAEYRFSIGTVPEPRRWLLILSGLALAGWVARRRLGHSF
jgi:hypothetical protein